MKLSHSALSFKPGWKVIVLSFVWEKVKTLADVEKKINKKKTFATCFSHCHLLFNKCLCCAYHNHLMICPLGNQLVFVFLESQCFLWLR